VIAVHGLGDHGGRYATLGESLVSRGWSLLVYDLPGHGLSPGKRGGADSFSGLLEDIAHVRRSAEQRFGRLPQVLLGHSMGGNLVFNYALRRRELPGCRDELRGLVLCAPMLLPPKPPPRPQILAAWLTGHLLPHIRVNRPVDAEALTGDPEQAAAIAADPMLHSQITIYLATQLLSQGRWALDHARDIDVPVLIMHGGNDPLIDRSACEHLPIRIGRLATGVRWPGRRHDLFHDRGREEVLARVAEWLQQVSSPAKTSSIRPDGSGD
jgi:alpha-beta hydrolase superfamily lysophospholipase